MKIRLEDIHKLVQEPYVSRGREYFYEGLVKIITVQSNLVKARIVGNRVYTVSLMLKNKTIEGRCSCPAFTDFGPCKHMAATCFAMLNDSYQSANEDVSYRFDEYENVEKNLKKLKKEELIEIILNVASEYPDIIDGYDL
jgi:uncharacterized Zn finger protein